MDYRKNHCTYWHIKSHIEIDLFRTCYITSDIKLIQSLKLERHLNNPSCRDGALYVLHEYINHNHIDASKIVRDEDYKILDFSREHSVV